MLCMCMTRQQTFLSLFGERSFVVGGGDDWSAVTPCVAAVVGPDHGGTSAARTVRRDPKSQAASVYTLHPAAYLTRSRVPYTRLPTLYPMAASCPLSPVATQPLERRPGKLTELVAYPGVGQCYAGQ